MKPEQLKLYNKYKYKDDNNEYIYIGKTKNKFYCFLFKHKSSILRFDVLNINNLNAEQIIKNLNLEIFIDPYGDKYIKEYSGYYFTKLDNLKPLLKYKLKNIINK